MLKRVLATVCRLALCLLILISSEMAQAADGPDYGRDVRPILSQFCFKCHGPDDTKREAGLRLDLREEAVKPASSGERPIVPTEPAASEVMRRIHSSDPDTQMPPASAKMVLTDAQKKTLQDWIAAGAEYRPHWSFVAPERRPLPTVMQKGWPRCGIDTFILSKLEAEHLVPSPEADRTTLIRRVSLDLIGLPPSLDEVDEFMKDEAPDAYEKIVDRLLASPHYGERWGRRWLDLARYADSNGYEKDRTRSIWPYRDWVIKALNANMPFDQFTVEQLAGDMLPAATQDQRIATGFHRNTMLNEEGGIDPLEFRFYAMTDRVATTSTVWLGLTLGCAQCHTHKYDPITHRDYYSFFALLNNADEPEIDVTRPDIQLQRQELDRKIAMLQADLPNRFPLPDEFAWSVARPISVKSTGGATMQVESDGSVLVSGTNPETDTYQIELESDVADVVAMRLEALSDPKLPNKGPGRTPHGNFVLSEFLAEMTPSTEASGPQRIRFIRASADFSQDNFPVEKAVDGETMAGGWAIHGPGEWNVNRTAIFHLEQPDAIKGKQGRWTVHLEQQFGKQHTIGKFRISFARRNPADVGSESERRLAHRNRKFSQWLAAEKERVVEWTALQPVSAAAELPLLTIQNDRSILVSGDMSKRDVYDIKFAAIPKRTTGSNAQWTAMRIEALPDASLPKNGPGRVFYEGPFGDFFMSEVTLQANGKPVKLTSPSQDFANGGNTAAMALDGNQQTGWSISGGQGKAHVAVFRFEQPVSRDAQLDLSMLFERYYAAGLGRFRVSVTDDSRPVEASSFPLQLESLLLSLQRESSALLAPDAEALLLRQFCDVAPELAADRKAIDGLRGQMASFPTTLAFQERPANNPRRTHRYHRGEFLQPKEVVEPAMLSALPMLPKNESVDRLTLARWLVSTSNPLGARVTVNREWMALFGRGLVRTVDDFGSQGASPTHPALLDWLAVELGGSQKSAPSIPLWDMKRLHRLIMTSATYRQSSRVTPELLAKDPQNEWLARGPRSRLEAEVVRDAALMASGLLSHKMLGPSVFPTQPSSVTIEGTYGGLSWNLSPGEDRYRRTLYTFSKRTAPFAMSLTFDAPSGEACVARREVTNTPLQALTLLNDTVFLEAAQSLGREFGERTGSVDERLTLLFRRCLTRPPVAEELSALNQFYDAQHAYLEANTVDVKALAGPGSDDVLNRATWTLVARAILNLDEAITKN
eukprot:TRINITY_DN567_c1_g2_i1.p1 TRINITY_DN567_c1_g2~~TRINITY_DN567_c1_g2_i1.p1  ORF type:complete len:1217 (-),score=231.02 TRINITY_DN567_c1_g2_i1:15451-19101(-)